MGHSHFPQVHASSIPHLTAAQMREVDRISIENFGLGLLQMMENAGMHLSAFIKRRFASSDVVVLAGNGGNGGGGLACARHLVNAGVNVAVALSHDKADLSDAARHQLHILEQMEIQFVEEPVAAGLVVDALVGYSLRGPLRGRTRQLADWANAVGGPVVSLDVPSGLDPERGDFTEASVEATATLTLALPKQGLVGAQETGELYLADISIPAGVYERLGLEVNLIFAGGPVVQVTS